MNDSPDLETNEPTATCLLNDCASTPKLRGYCKKHYHYLMKKGLLARKPPGPQFCTAENCIQKSVSKGLCQTHSAGLRHTSPPASDHLKCRIDGCPLRYHARRLCRTHYKRMRLHDDPLLILRKKNRGCLIRDCPHEHSGRGYCSKHFARLNRHGDPEKVISLHGEGATPEERFWSRIDRSGGETACWNWRGAVIAESGYGLTRYGGNRRHTHRIAWLIKYGKLPNAEIRQICGNRLCCNPAHLRIE